MAVRGLPSITELTDELFTLVQEDQGKAHVTDGDFGVRSHWRFFNVVRGLLYRQERGARKMRKFLRKYGAL